MNKIAWYENPLWLQYRQAQKFSVALAVNIGRLTAVDPYHQAAKDNLHNWILASALKETPSEHLFCILLSNTSETFLTAEIRPQIGVESRPNMHPLQNIEDEATVQTIQ